MKINNKKNLLLYILMFVISFFIIMFTYNNYFLYKNAIFKVSKVEMQENRVGENKEIYYSELVTGIIQNGIYKNKILELENYSTTSGVYDDHLYVGSELIVELNEDGTKVLSIVNIKRDKYIATLLVLFINLLIIVGKKQGFKTLISLIINICISITAITIYQNYFDKINILLLFIPIVICFISISLLITNGFTKKQ